MQVAVIQSNYIPWRGYFDFINSVDTFVIYDDVQFSKGSWRNRNKVKFRNETKWITLPVKINLGMLINEVKINNSKDWKKEHADLFKLSLSHAPNYKEAIELWDEGVNKSTEYLSELNEHMMKTICSYMGISTKFVRSEKYNLSGTKTDRLMDLFTKLDCTSYLSGPAADDYLDFEHFRNNKIALKYKSYDYNPYPQHDGFEFNGGVSIIDLIANTGKQALIHCTSKSTNQIIVE
ncbi:MAG: WbqC family protein [bacterium]|nr:WbqC family protein [bacterium]